MPTSSDSPAPDRISLFDLWRRIRPARLWPMSVRIAVCFAMLLVESGATVTAPWLFSRMVAVLSNRQMLVGIPLWLLAQYAIICALAGISEPLRQMLVTPLSADLRRRVAVLGLRHLHGMSVRFHLDRQTGALTRTLDRGVEAVGTLLSLILFNVLPNVIELALTLLVILKVFDWRYVVLLVGAMAVYGGTSYVFTRLRMTARRARNAASSHAQHYLVDSVLNFETVRSFGNEDYEIARFDKTRAAVMRHEIRLQNMIGWSQVSRNMIIALTTTMMLVFAAHDIVAGKVGVAQFVLIGTYLRSLYSSVGALNYVSAGWRNATVDLEHYLELLARTSEIRQAEEPVALASRLAEGGAAGISFRNVSFSYSKERQILYDVSIEIPAGSSVAIVGPTGSGKSTLGRLLTRAYDPTEGEIRIDGHDLRDIALEDVSGVIGTVPQDTTLFNDTIGRNIAYGDVSSTQEAVALAAQRAQIADFIAALPAGFETVVGERGLKLSGGEKQRVAIARVILKDPRILLLDEATSALDTATEAAIQSELEALSVERTTVTVAHRLSTVQNADQIIVLENGRVTERGTHAELLAAEGVYERMWRVQAGESVIQA